MTAMMRMTQLISCGVQVDVANTVGHYECSNFPPSLFHEDGTMRLQGTKSSLVKVLLKETNVTPVSTLPDVQLNTAVVLDAMHCIHKWSFNKGDTFGNIADRYLHRILHDIPSDTKIIHVCCDRYRDTSLKLAMRQHRQSHSHKCKSYEVCTHYRTPEAGDFFAMDDNKAALLSFLCEEWSATPLSQPGMQLYLGGGFHEETKTMLVTDQSVSSVLDLQSTQEEADTRIILHLIHAVSNGVERVVIHANDTDVIVLCIYYLSTDKLNTLKELWVRTEQDKYIPIHDITAALGPAMCQRLPFVHSLSGRDTTSYPYFTGKKAWFESMQAVDTPAIETFGEEDTELSDDVYQEARSMCICVYSSKDDDFDDIASLRAHKFLRYKSAATLKLLPPTEDSFRQHVKRCALATIIDKRAHVAQPALPPYTNFGWSIENTEQTLQPVQSTANIWPEQMSQSLSCNCKTGCLSKRCSCSRRGVRCYIGCHCTGTREKCARFQDTASDSDVE